MLLFCRFRTGENHNYQEECTIIDDKTNLEHALKDIIEEKYQGSYLEFEVIDSDTSTVMYSGEYYGDRDGELRIDEEHVPVNRTEGKEGKSAFLEETDFREIYMLRDGRYVNGTTGKMYDSIDEILAEKSGKSLEEIALLSKEQKEELVDEFSDNDALFDLYDPNDDRHKATCIDWNKAFGRSLRGVNRYFSTEDDYETHNWAGPGLPYVPNLEEYNSGIDVLTITPEQAEILLKRYLEDSQLGRDTRLFTCWDTFRNEYYDITLSRISHIYVTSRDEILEQDEEAKSKNYESYKKSIIECISMDENTIVVKLINDDLIHDEDFVSKVKEMEKNGNQLAHFVNEYIESAKSREIVSTVADIVSLELGQNGYNIDGKPLKLPGKTKMASFFEKYGQIHTQLESTYEQNDEIPIFRLSIMNSDGEIIWSEENNSPEFMQLGEELNWGDDGMDLYTPEGREKIAEALNIKDEEIYCSLDFLVMAYSTALPPKVNRELLSKYFDAVSELETVSETHVQEFISCHKQDLIECFGGKEQLIEFIKSMPGLKGISELIKEVEDYSPQEIIDSINPPQGLMDEVIAETAREATTRGATTPETKRPGDNGSNPGGDNR